MFVLIIFSKRFYAILKTFLYSVKYIDKNSPFSSSKTVSELAEMFELGAKLHAEEQTKRNKKAFDQKPIKQTSGTGIIKISIL
jgi:hypothetical protein